MNRAAVIKNILVIDEAPLIALGLQAALATLNPSVTVEYRDNLLSVLSSGKFENASFDTVVLGNLPDDFPESLQEILSDLKQKFGNPRVMVYVSHYNPLIPEKMKTLGIDAYVHKYEAVEAIHLAFKSMADNREYVSDIFSTLYNDYHLNPALHETGQEPVLITPVEKYILCLLCQGKSAKEIAANVQMQEAELKLTLDILNARLGGG